MSVILRETESPVAAPVTERDVLHRAADLLEEFGWQQGAPGSCASGAMCAVGAIWEASRTLGVSISELWTMEVIGYPHENELDLVPLAQFNDEPGRTRSEVTAFLRAAAESA